MNILFAGRRCYVAHAVTLLLKALRRIWGVLFSAKQGARHEDQQYEN
jgi:hypothetical protein